MLNQSIGGEVMSCLVANDCLRLASQLVVTVDPLILLKFLVTDQSISGENFPYIFEYIGKAIASCQTNQLVVKL